MGGSKPDTTYGLKHPPVNGNGTEEEEEELTEVTRLHEELEEKLRRSREKLNGVARKGDALRQCLKRPDSVSKMKAVLAPEPDTRLSDK